MNLEEFKEYAKTVTRKEFLTNRGNLSPEYRPQLIFLGGHVCPNSCGLKIMNCREYIRCIDCWEEAIKDIQFKDDIEKAQTITITNNKVLVNGKPFDIKLPDNIIAGRKNGVDNVNRPSHYTQGKYEVIDYIEDKLSKEELQGYFVGNVIKYISRFKHKNGVEDLKKAEWYLNRLIDKLEG